MGDHLAIFFFVLLAFILILFLVFRFYKKPLSQSLHSESTLVNHDSEKFSEHLTEEEKTLLENILEFREGIVREVMIPRIDIVAIEDTTTLERFRLLAVEKGHSRIPVYHKTIDQVVGIAYVKDMLRYWDAKEQDTLMVAEFMRPPYFIPETKNIRALLHEFQSKKVHIAIAIDEYGGTAGIVTIEDLLEVIFGDITDEHDEEEEELITRIDEHTIEVNAKASIDDLEEYVGELIIEHHDFDSVGGLLFSILGEIPKQGEVATYQHLKFTILEADKHRIVRVKVERMPA